MVFFCAVAPLLASLAQAFVNVCGAIYLLLLFLFVLKKIVSVLSTERNWRWRKQLLSTNNEIMTNSKAIVFWLWL